MRTTLLSYSGPGVMLPSCVFRGGQRLTLPETCSACAHTGSQSTATSTTIRYNKQNTHNSTPVNVSGCWHISRCRGAVLSCVGVPVLLLSFTIASCDLISLMCHREEKKRRYTVFLHQSLRYNKCMLFLNRVQVQTERFPFCFRLPVENVQGTQA